MRCMVCESDNNVSIVCGIFVCEDCMNDDYFAEWIGEFENQEDNMEEEFPE